MHYYIYKAKDPELVDHAWEANGPIRCQNICLSGLVEYTYEVGPAIRAEFDIEVQAGGDILGYMSARNSIRPLSSMDIKHILQQGYSIDTSNLVLRRPYAEERNVYYCSSGFYIRLLAHFFPDDVFNKVAVMAFG